MNTIRTISYTLMLLTATTIASSQNGSRANETSIHGDKHLLNEQHTLYDGTGSLIFKDGNIEDLSGEESSFFVKTNQEISRNNKGYIIISGSHNHWNARRAFYGCVEKENGKVLWIKSCEKPCDPNHSQGVGTSVNEKEQTLHVNISYLSKSHTWNDTLAQGYAQLEVAIDDLHNPSIVSVQHYSTVEMETLGANQGFQENKDFPKNHIGQNERRGSNDQAVIELWPNPSQSTLHLVLETSPQKMQLVDSWGRVVATPTPSTRSIDVSGFDDGIYFVVLHYQQNVRVLKFVKS